MTQTPESHPPEKKSRAIFFWFTGMIVSFATGLGLALGSEGISKSPIPTIIALGLLGFSYYCGRRFGDIVVAENKLTRNE